ncbi:MAG: VWA domain-containing protein [Phycisphaerae bacterium]|nr:VWA domain-containing protein [Phycisphaerae bacterium]
MTTSHDPSPQPDDPRNAGPPPADELDRLLRAWHEQNTQRAHDLRDRLMIAIAKQDQTNPTPSSLDDHEPQVAPASRRATAPTPSPLYLVRRFLLNRYSPIAATLILAAVLVPLLMPPGTSPTYARNVILAPEGGRLDALDRDGQVMGPCPLRHTDVDVSISAFFSRVRVTQRFQNTYADKVEAVYTFPLSHRAAVDRMTMTVGDRVIVGEVHERQRARRMYEAAREQGYVASLLEQERPNIFTQSVANIEPGAEVTIDISYVEMLESKDGLYSFNFPMVVGPRYVPGTPTGDLGAAELPPGLKRRGGITLMAPATLTIGDAGDTSRLGTLQSGRLDTLLQNAVPISVPDATWWARLGQGGTGVSPVSSGGEPALWYRFEASYPNGAKERGTLHTDGTGQINGRWFYVNTQTSAEPGTGFSPNTNRVPDAAKITPMPVKPDKRAGHDVSLRVTIDTGGPGILSAKSELHEVVRTETVKRDDGNPRKLSLELMKADEIPNRDFILNWHQTADTIQEATFTHTDKNGKFFTLIVQPPDRVTHEQAVPRELIFVLDSSGSMSGFPIEKAKEVMSKAIDTLRPRDTFNLITFSGDTRILWDKPRPFNQANRDEAQAFLAARQGSGGTEMMKAINAALIQTASSAAEAITLEQLADLPADGRTVSVRLDWSKHPGAMLSLPYKIEGDRSPLSFALKNGAAIETHIPVSGLQKGDDRNLKVSVLTGKWQTRHGHAMLIVDQVDWIRPPTEGPVRICCFMTDGYVGNDMQIIDAIRRNAHTTRVFSFGIGNSVNRYLLDNMAKAGRGEVEYVQVRPGSEAANQPGGQNDAVEQAVARFSKRIQTPVLMDVSLAFSENLDVTDLVPTQVPDLYDVKPLVLHGRYTRPGQGTLTIRGRSGSGPYQRILPLDLPDSQPEHDTIATLWARARVESIMNQDLAAMQRGAFPEPLKSEIVDLGERFGMMTPFTSFVAVEKARITIGGQPRLVAVPIEMPQGVSYEGIFGPCVQGTASADTLSKDCLREIRFAAKVTAMQAGQAAGRQSDKPAFTPFSASGDLERQEQVSTLNTLAKKPEGTVRGIEQETLGNDFTWGLRSEHLSQESLYGQNTEWADASAFPGLLLDGRPDVGARGYFSYYPSNHAWDRYDVDGDGASVSYGFQARYGNTSVYDFYGLVPGQLTNEQTVGLQFQPSTPLTPFSTRHDLNVKSATAQRGQVNEALIEAGSRLGSTATAGEAARQIEIVQLRKGKASEVASMIREVLSSGKHFVRGAPDSLKVTADDQTDMLVLNGTDKERDLAKRMLATLDVKAPAASQPGTQPAQAAISAPARPPTTQPAEPAETTEMVALLDTLGTDQGRAWATQTLLRERLALLVAALVKERRIDQAQKLANALATLAPDFPPAVQMAKVLASPSLAPAERDRQIAALANEALKPIEAAVRRAKIIRRLHPELQKIVKTPETKPADTRISDANADLIVTVLATDTQPNTLAALKQAGFRVEAVAERAKLAVGRIAPDKLENVASLDVVRKIDPDKR